MGSFLHLITIIGPLGEETLEALADTGASHTLIPRPILDKLGVQPAFKWPFVLADGREVEYDMAVVDARLDSQELPTLVIFGPADADPLLGVYTLEGFRLGVDPVGQRLVPVPGRLKMIERYTRPEMGRIWADEHKFELWLKAELAACEGWAELGAIPHETLPKLALARVNKEAFERYLAETHHDMTAFLRAVAESLGEESRFIHLGLTSSDVMDTATSLQMVEAALLLEKDISQLILTLEERARQHKKTIMIGRTHGVHAEPITFGLKLALWTQEMRRNLFRLQDARKMVAFGKFSGVVGTYATVPPEVEFYACRKLGLQPAPISNQVIQRDRHAQFLSTLAICAGSLEKFATEIRSLQRTEIREMEEPFEEGRQTGSSAMPHKRNPELCERICGQARLMRSYALTALENITLWGERDISHSSTERLILPDACILLDYMLDTFTEIIDGLRVYPHRMLRNLEATQGLVFSQRVLLALIQKGLSRQEAYSIVQRNAMEAWKGELDFRELLRADPEVTRHLSAEELEPLFDYEYYTRYVDEIYQRLGI